MFILLLELISASCRIVAHIAIYVNLLQEPYILSRYFSSNYDKFAQQKLLLSSDVELNSGSSDMDAVLSCHTGK